MVGGSRKWKGPDRTASLSETRHSYAWHRYIQAQRQRRKHEFELGKLVVNSKKVAHEELNEVTTAHIPSLVSTLE